MKAIYLIAKNTVKELLRNRLLYIVLLFAFFLIGLMGALGQLSHTEQLRLTLGLGLPSVHLCVVLLTIFIGGSLVYKEIEKLTILTLLSRSVGRTEFLLGKYLGFLFMLLCILIGLLAVFSLNMVFMGFDVSYVKTSVVFLGFFLEISLLLAVTIFFSTFCASFLAVSFTLSFFVIGHWIHNLEFLVRHSESEMQKQVAWFLGSVFPNLETYNWRDFPLTHNLTASQLGVATIHCLCWVLFFLSVSSLIFKRRDFA